MVDNHDTRVIGALESKIAKLESERYTDYVGIDLYKEMQKAIDDIVDGTTLTDLIERHQAKLEEK